VPIASSSAASLKSDTLRPQKKEGYSQSRRNTREASVADDEVVTQKEQIISQIVGSGRPFTDIASDLLTLLPNCKGSEQILVASHLSQLADGEQFNQLVKFLNHSRIDKMAKEEIFTAIFNREPKKAALSLIQVIEDGAQEYTSEAEQALSILLQADHGTDVVAWKSELDAQGNFLKSDELGE
jgi:hypothetical protein